MENVDTIRNNQKNQVKDRIIQLERDKKNNELYPKNMKDESKTLAFERSLEKKK